MKTYLLLFFVWCICTWIKCQTLQINNLATWKARKTEKGEEKVKSFFYFQILPGLESFCAYCAIGIGAIYLFQCSWFVAWLSLDQRRIEARRDGLIPCCLVHKDWNPSTHRNQDNWTRNAFTYFANLVRNKIFKVSKPLTNSLHNDPDIHILSKNAKNELSHNFFSLIFFLYNFFTFFYFILFIWCLLKFLKLNFGQKMILTIVWYVSRFFGICKNEKSFDKDEKLFTFNLQ